MDAPHRSGARGARGGERRSSRGRSRGRFPCGRGAHGSSVSAFPRTAGRVTSRLLPELGAPTRITMLRGLLVAMASGFLRAPYVVAPAYSAAAILDFVDGQLARRAKRETILGSRLDMEVDAAGILVASLSRDPSREAAALRTRPSASRATLRPRDRSAEERWENPVRDLDSSRLRRLLAGCPDGVSRGRPLASDSARALTGSRPYPFGAATLDDVSS